jgi:hypothetical protein
MSLVASFASLASSLIGPSGIAGAAVTFTRTTPGLYDGVSGSMAPDATQTWAATALEVAPDPRSTDAQPGPTGQRMTARTFRVPGLGIIPPRPGDLLTVGGQSLRVTDVTVIGRVDAATPVLYTVGTSA